MPTETGLRLFVDGMMQVAEPTRQERAAIEKRLANPDRSRQRWKQASTILSDISGAAGMVMVPTREPRLAQMSLVPLSPTRALAVMVGEDGQIENRILELTEPAASQLAGAGEQLHHRAPCRANPGRSRRRNDRRN